MKPSTNSLSRRQFGKLGLGGTAAMVFGGIGS